VGYHCVVSGPREYEKTRSRSIGRSMALYAGGRAFVRADGWRCALSVWRGLLRGWLLQHTRAPSPQIAAGSRARHGSYELRARHERDDVMLDVLLQRSGAARADTGRIRVACDEFCSCGK